MGASNLPPTQHLVLEVLAARHRLGENTWTFPARCTQALNALERRGWVWHKGGVFEGTRLAGLTNEGKAEWLLPDDEWASYCERAGIGAPVDSTSRDPAFAPADPEVTGSYALGGDRG